jgi:hypothetical protein
MPVTRSCRTALPAVGPYPGCLAEKKRRQCCLICEDAEPCSAVLRRIDRLDDRLLDRLEAVGWRDLEGVLEAAKALLPSRQHGYYEAPRPPRPTRAEPGSLRKLKVFRKRLRKGYALHHPDDRRIAPPAGATQKHSARYKKETQPYGWSHRNDDADHHAPPGEDHPGQALPAPADLRPGGDQ